MNKKKIGLIIGTILFISILVIITVIYNKNVGNQQQLEEDAVNTGVIRVNDTNFKEEVLQSDKIVVVDFYENMCAPCTSMIPTMIKLAKMKEDVKVVMINSAANDTKTATEKYEVSATPTIVILKEGQEVKKFIGATKEEEIMDVIKELMENNDEK